MKGNNIDNLFRNKLDSHRSEAPTGAWEKIEAGLPQKKKRGVYFWGAMAASFTLIASIGWVLVQESYDVQSLNDQQLLSEETKELSIEGPENTVPGENKKLQAGKKQEAPIQVIDPIDDHPQVLLADNTNRIQGNTNQQVSLEIAKNEVIRQNLNIDLLKPKMLSPFLLADQTSFKSININLEVLLRSAALSRQEFLAQKSRKDKNSGFLNSIVSVAKTVNDGAKVLSDIRKSKNEFVSSDLKYGVDADSEAEESEDDEPHMNK